MELKDFSEPDLRKVSGLVYEIWEDGEITLQKSGNLYGLRNLHMIVPGFPGVNVELPDKHGNHSCMALAQANIPKARAMIAQIAGVEDEFANLLPGRDKTGKELIDEIYERNTKILKSE